MMQKFEIWLEGFAYGGDTVKAQMIGVSIGYDFRDAVIRYYQRNPCETFDPVRLTDYRCNIFPTEEEARKSYG